MNNEEKGVAKMQGRVLGVCLWCLSVWLIVCSCSAQHMNAKDGPCQEAGSGAETTACFYQAYKASDAELNQIYSRILTVVDGDNLANLREVQRLWIQFRDANCSAEYELYRGGSAAPMVKFACLEAVTRDRTEELKVMYGWRLEKWSK
ncbi:MAG: lysozyme inhibitor LprI family protein [Terracidiphilus sp.]